MIIKGMQVANDNEGAEVLLRGSLVIGEVWPTFGGWAAYAMQSNELRYVGTSSTKWGAVGLADANYSGKSGIRSPNAV